ncbi:MAG TPA: autotransporter-associated beta strand repeat-containing protein, partial [Lacipirellulaceae bacterium]|nr:autotransporter-associated beta strand repeat-containing protein [Lacipirellulaceae bacterium]
WGGNAMGIAEAEQIEHEYYYRSRLALHSQKPQWLSDGAININGTIVPLSWSQPLNWLGGVPNAPGAEVNFWRTLTANRTVTLDGSKTVGTMSFDSPYRYTIDPGTGGSIVFDNTRSAAGLTSSQGNHTIGTSVQLTSSLSASIDAGALTISGAISGAGSLTKSGAGTLALTGESSYTGDTDVRAGTLTINTASLSNTADVLLSSGATLNLQFSGGADTIHSLLLNNVSQVIGGWGAIGNANAMYHTPLIAGPGVLQVTAGPIVGDYNNDGKVDGSDFVVWRRTSGSAAIANRDPNNTGTVGEADFLSWRAHFGQTVASSGTAAGLGSTNAPEPRGASLIAAGLLIMILLHRANWGTSVSPAWYAQSNDRRHSMETGTCRLRLCRAVRGACLKCPSRPIQ